MLVSSMLAFGVLGGAEICAVQQGKRYVCRMVLEGRKEETEAEVICFPVTIAYGCHCRAANVGSLYRRKWGRLRCVK